MLRTWAQCTAKISHRRAKVRACGKKSGLCLNSGLLDAQRAVATRRLLSRLCTAVFAGTHTARLFGRSNRNRINGEPEETRLIPWHSILRYCEAKAEKTDCDQRTTL